MVLAMMTIGEKLHRMRAEAGWSQERLGRALGHKQAWVSRRELGTAAASVEDVQKIAKVLGYNAEMVISKHIGDEVLRALGTATEAQQGHALLILRASEAMAPEAFELITDLIENGIKRAEAGDLSAV